MPTRLRQCALFFLAALLTATLATIASAQTQSTVGTSSGPPLRIKQLRQDFVIDSQGRRVTTTATQFQVLSAAMVPLFSQIPVRFDATVEDAEVLEAYTLKPDGRKITVDPGNIITQKAPQANALLPLYSDAEQKIIIYPNVEVGDSLVFTSKVTEKSVALPGQFTLSRYFNTNVVADDDVYSITVPKSMHVNLGFRDMTRDVSTQGDLTTYRLGYSNPTAKAQPTRVVADPDAGPHFLVSSFKDYEDFAHRYAGLIRPKIAVTPEIQKQADTITAGVSGHREQARAIYDWVNRHIRYVAIEFGTGGVIPHDPNWTLNNGFGDCKDQAILFASLLKAKGIAADPVLINALTRYRLSGVPTVSEFNHMITWLPEFHTYADTTLTGLPFQMLAFQEYGKPVLHLVDTGTAGHSIPALPPEIVTSTYKVHAVMNSEGRFDVEVMTSATGPWAASLRRISDSIETMGGGPAAITLLKAHNFPTATGTFTPVVNSSVAGSVSIAGTFHTTNPLADGNIMALTRALQILSRAGDGPMGPLGNTTLADTEETPCYSGHQIEDIVIDFANGEHLANTPSNVHLRTDNITYDVQWSVSDRTVSLHREFVSKIAEPTCKGQIRQETAQLLAKIRDDYALPARTAAK